MKPKGSSELWLEILAGFLLLLSVMACGPTATPALPPKPTQLPTFELLAGTLMSWWDGSNIVYVPPGEFIMGGPEASGGDNLPAHTVSLDGFWIQRTEVTNRMYAQCVAAGACPPITPDPNYPNHYPKVEYANHPVASATWQEAADYCTWIDGQLPSEAEWEWAARGESGDPYPWGEQDPNCSRLNYRGCTVLGTTVPVGSYPLGLSPFNAADMAGNVFEWVHDWYGEEYYSAAPARNPTGPGSGEVRVVRSSSFRSEAEVVPVTLRFYQDPETGRADLGFRCILSGEAVSHLGAPACTTLSYEPNPIRPLWITHQGEQPPAFSLAAYCHLQANGNQFGTAAIQFEAGTEPAQLELSSPEGTLECNPDANDPLLLICVGSALQPGSPVTVKACNSLQSGDSQSSPTCPSIAGLSLTQEGAHIRVKWNATPQESCDKIITRLRCDDVNTMNIALPGSQTEIVIDGCPQPYANQEVCVSCLDPDGNPCAPSCGQLSFQTQPTCPQFYELNPTTNLCEYSTTPMLACDPPSVAVPGYGCLPSPQGGECPVGWYQASFFDEPVCIPAGGPVCQGENCPATCPNGLVFNENLFCCEYPPDMKPVCPVGYIFDPDLDTCVPEESIPNGCTSITVQVPDCSPVQPGPTGCLVTNPSTGGQYCAVPCPVGLPNFGVCSP